MVNSEDVLKTKSRIAVDIVNWDRCSDHRTGTAGDLATSEWLVKEIDRTGLPGQVVEFDFPRRTPVDCCIRVDDRIAEGVPFFDGGITGNAGTTTQLSPIAEGKGLTVGDFTSSGGDEETQLLQKQRANPKVVGIIGITKMVSPGIGLLNADNYKTPYGVPVLQVDQEHREWLSQAAAQHKQATLKVHFELNLVQATNVQVLVKGKRPRALEPVVIMTPKSSWWTSTAERCGGITLWLETIRHFAQNQPWRSVIFTANTGHELGHVGLDHFIAQNPKLLQNAHLWLHLGANFAASKSKLRIQASGPVLLKMGHEQFTPDTATPCGQRPGGEARNIYDGGGAFFSLLGSNGRFHHPSDRYPANVDVEKTLQLRNQFVEFADQLANEH